MSDDPLSSQSMGAATYIGAGPLVCPADPQIAECLQRWLGASTDAHSVDTQLFAKLIAARDVRDELALLGLQRREWDALLSRHFSHASATETPNAVDADTNGNASATPGSRLIGISVKATSPAPAVHEHIDFVRSLHSLLFAHASPSVDTADAHDLATIIVHACLRPDHLWRDLGLAGRDEVTWMLTRYFPALVALNVANLRWKKFLAGQRALSLGLPPGPAPGCPGCEDYAHCFPLR